MPKERRLSISLIVIDDSALSDDELRAKLDQIMNSDVLGRQAFGVEVLMAGIASVVSACEADSRGRPPPVRITLGGSPGD